MYFKMYLMYNHNILTVHKHFKKKDNLYKILQMNNKMRDKKLFL